MELLIGITLLLIYQLAGESIALLAGLPIPGPVIGMLLLFLTLLARGQVAVRLETAANGLLSHLSLLFVPAGVGVLVHIDMIAFEWLPISAALIISTLITLAVTALIMKWSQRLTGKGGKADERH